MFLGLTIAYVMFCVWYAHHKDPKDILGILLAPATVPAYAITKWTIQRQVRKLRKDEKRQIAYALARRIEEGDYETVRGVFTQ